MKKRLFGFLPLIFILLLCLSAQAAEYTPNGVFRIEYDETQLTLDDTTYKGDSTATYQWLFLLHDENNVLDISTETIKEYEGVTLYTADDAVLRRYQQDVLDAFSDKNAVFVTQRIVSDLRIPFFIFRLQDEEGTYYLAETVINGQVFDFQSYPATMNQASEINFELLCRLLDTFEWIEGEAEKDSQIEELFL